MVRIRLRREGTRNRPFYRVVVADARASRQGPYIEALGYYDPLPNPPVIVIDEERTLFWLKRGAQPTEVAIGLLSRLGILEKYKKEERR